MATFPLLIVRFFFFKINTIETINEIEKLCKFHKNPSKNVHFTA